MPPTGELYVEIRAAVKRGGRPKLVPLAEVGKYTGFRSVFAYPKAVAEKIIQQCGSHGLRGQPVYADVLLMDFDNVDPSLFRDWLVQQGIAFERYDSGNRSIHFHIPLQPIQGDWVPQACKQWVEAHSIVQADTSFYHPAGVFRLPGTYHTKNPGRCKELLESVPGKLLVLEPPALAAVPELEHEADEEPMHFYAALLLPANEGDRRPTVFRLAVAGLRSGHDPDDVAALLSWWNSTRCYPPHDNHAIEQQINGAIRYVSNLTF